jgi:hypothetical protein
MRDSRRSARSEKPGVRLRAAALCVLLVAAPKLALACSVCMSGRDAPTRNAFLLTTALLTVLPLAAVGGFVWWMRRRLRELEGVQPGRLQPARLQPALSRTSSSR